VGGTSGSASPKYSPRRRQDNPDESQSAKIEARQVFLPKQAPWLGDLQAELLQFPNGRHYDQVEAFPNS
jgi:phage terminase large subunit-like protein